MSFRIDQGAMCTVRLLYYCRGWRARCAESFKVEEWIHRYTECFNINIKCSFQNSTRAACAYKINKFNIPEKGSLDALTCTSFDYLLYTWGEGGGEVDVTLINIKSTLENRKP